MYGAGAVWSCLFLPVAGADPIWSEPESATGPRTSGAVAAQKSSGSATLILVPRMNVKTGTFLSIQNLHSYR